jgi:hypothetical protein
MELKSVAGVVLVAALVGNAQAALFDRGGGLLYDDVLNVTWLQDANYSKSSGYDADGLMTLSQATEWAENLAYFDSVRSVSYSDWRLASNKPVNGVNWQLSYSFDGSTDNGHNIVSQNSELSFQYFVNLGLKAIYSSSGAYQANFGIFGNGTFGGQVDVGLVKNLQSNGGYWSGGIPLDQFNPWYFGTATGTQSTGATGPLYAWAVRDGDVASVAAPIPEPETYAMMLAGLGLLGVMTRRRKHAQH